MSKNTQGSNYRDSVNGPKTIQSGTIAAKGITTFSEAVRLRDALARDYPDFDHHVSGVQGDYHVVQYSRTTTPLNYEKE